LEILFLRLLYGAGRFICLLAIYVKSVDGSPRINSAALIPAARGVSGSRPCIGFCFRSACLLLLDYIPTDTFILVIVYEHNGNVLLEYKDSFLFIAPKYLKENGYL
jgi:hypothetical protein